MPGFALRKSGEVGRQLLGDGAGIGRHPQVALDAARELDHLVLQRVQRCMQGADMAQQRAAGFGGLDAARAALEQADAQARLEIRHPFAGRGQRQALALGATGDAAGVGNGQHEVQGGEVEAHGEKALRMSPSWPAPAGREHANCELSLRDTRRLLPLRSPGCL